MLSITAVFEKEKPKGNETIKKTIFYPFDGIELNGHVLFIINDGKHYVMSTYRNMDDIQMCKEDFRNMDKLVSEILEQIKEFNHRRDQYTPWHFIITPDYKLEKI